MVIYFTINSLSISAVLFPKTIQHRTDMETSTPTFDQLPHVVSGLSEKLDRVLDLLEKAGIASHSKQSSLHADSCMRKKLAR